VDAVSVNPGSLVYVNGIPFEEAYFRIGDLERYNGYLSQKDRPQVLSQFHTELANDGTTINKILLYHPVTDVQLTETELSELFECGDAGEKVKYSIVPPEPTGRSLKALIALLLHMVIPNGDDYYYDDMRDPYREFCNAQAALDAATDRFYSTLATYPRTEQNAFWNTRLPGVGTQPTIAEIFGRSIARATRGNAAVLAYDSAQCTYAHGKRLALVIHQYYRDADSELQKDARLACLLEDPEKKLVAQYARSNPKIPAKDNLYSRIVKKPAAQAGAAPLPSQRQTGR
jgi:hypothetical protein